MDTSPSNEFSKSFDVSYANELKLNCENHRLHATFLDMDISC